MGELVIKKFLVFACVVTTMLNWLVGLFGCVCVFQAGSEFTYLFSGIMGFLLLGLLLNTENILKITSFPYSLMKIFWVLGLVANFLFVLAGLIEQMTKNQPTVGTASLKLVTLPEADYVRLVLIAVFTTFIVGVPVAFSHVLRLCKDRPPG